MPTGSGDEERALGADKRDFVADRRDEVADERDRVADTRDRTADDREAISTSGNGTWTTAPRSLALPLTSLVRLDSGQRPGNQHVTGRLADKGEGIQDKSAVFGEASASATAALDVKRRTFLLATVSCALAACTPATRRSGSAPSPAATEQPEPAGPASSASATGDRDTSSEPDPSASRPAGADRTSREALIRRYSGRQPTAWGEAVPKVVPRLPTSDRVVALTLDACGGRTGSGYDAKLIKTLRREGVPATLFVNARWIRANPRIFRRLAADPLFEIANHGTEHRPLSVTGRSVYGIAGTASIGEVVDEVAINQRLITRLTGAAPAFFRSGTAYYDDVAVRVVADLGLQVVNFDVLGDAGATYSAAQVADAMLTSKPGSIILAHMNQPASRTAEGIKEALPELRQRGFRFVRLSDYLR